jgi:hypothetical protein
VGVTLLGPQRTPTVRRVLRSLPIEGRVATVTAGWREREPDDGELNEELDGRAVNLRLFRRWLDVQERDPDFAAAYRRLRRVLDEVQETYLVRLEYALRAVEAVRHTGPEGPRRDDSVADAIASVRELDAKHLQAVGDTQIEFYERWVPHDRPVITEHRKAVERLMADTGALVVTGGHLDVLLSVLHLFNIAGVLRTPVIAWSAGAIALTDRVVLFHDRAPQGPGNAEIYERGVSVVRGIVALPHARARLLLDDIVRMSVFARRFEPARCVPLERGARVDTDADGTCPPGTRILGLNGRVQTLEAPS